MNKKRFMRVFHNEYEMAASKNEPGNGGMPGSCCFVAVGFDRVGTEQAGL